MVFAQLLLGNLYCFFYNRLKRWLCQSIRKYQESSGRRYSPADMMLQESSPPSMNWSHGFPSADRLSDRPSAASGMMVIFIRYREAGPIFQSQVLRDRTGHQNVSWLSVRISVTTYFPSIIRGIEKVLSAAGIQVSIAATGNRIDLERKILQNIIDSCDVDGIIAEGTKTGFPNPNIPLYRRIKEMGIPVIFLHCSYPELDDAVVVGMNDMAGGRYIADYLIGKGYRKFGAIFKSDDRQGLLRYAGFCEGLINAGLSLDCVRPRWYTTEDVYASTEGVPDEVPVDYFTGDALVCYNDMVATAAITDYEKRGIPVPLILSFDSSHLCQAYPGRILSLGHRKDELGETAAVKMINMLSGKTEESVLMDWIC